MTPDEAALEFTRRVLALWDAFVAARDAGITKELEEAWEEKFNAVLDWRDTLPEEQQERVHAALVGTVAFADNLIKGISKGEKSLATFLKGEKRGAW